MLFISILANVMVVHVPDAMMSKNLEIQIHKYYIIGDLIS